MQIPVSVGRLVLLFIMFVVAYETALRAHTRCGTRGSARRPFFISTFPSCRSGEKLPCVLRPRFVDFTHACAGSPTRVAATR